MNEFIKTLSLNFKALFDKSSFKETQQQIDSFTKDAGTIKVNFDFNEEQIKLMQQEIKSEFNSTEIANLNLFNAEELKEFENKFHIIQELTLQENKLMKAMSEIKMFDKNNKHLDEIKAKLKDIRRQKEEIQGIDEEDEEEDKQFDKTSFKEGFQNAAKDYLQQNTLAKQGANAFNKMERTISKWKDEALNAIKNFVKEALKELSEMASWDVFNSTQYNKEASEMYMNYGLQGEEAYAMNTALEATGINDIETYLTDPLVQGNQALLDTFRESYELAKANYQNNIELAREYQEFQTEFKLFKQELQKEVIDFFMANKDTIMGAIKFIMQTIEVIANILNSIFGWLVGSNGTRTDTQRQSDMNEILGIESNYDNSKTDNSKHNNVNVNNTYNGVGKTDQTFFQNVGQLTYQQIIEYLGRE